MKFFVLPLILLFLLPVSSEARPRNFYEAVICDDCSYIEAKRIAQRQKYQPEMRCHNNVGNGFEDIVYEQCWSTPTNLVIHDVQQAKTYGFSIGHQNQGRPYFELTPYVQDLTTIPNQINTLLTNTTNGYKVLTNVTRHLNRSFKIDAYTSSSNSFQAFDYDIDENSVGIMTSCSNSPEMKAMKLAGSIVAKSKLQIEANEKAINDGNYKNSFQGTRIKGANFEVSLGSFGIGGTVEYFDVTQNIITDFTFKSEYFGQGTKNKVVFDLTMKNGGIEVSTNQSRTVIGGFPLSQIKSSGNAQNTLNAQDISKCLAEAIDNTFAKTVSNSSGGSLSAPGSDTTAPTFKHIPLSFSGGGGDSTCTHTYHDRMGEPIFSFEGPCP